MITYINTPTDLQFSQIKLMLFLFNLFLEPID